MPLTEYEQKARTEVEAFFRSPEDGPLGRLSRALFKPVELVAERIVPDKVLELAGDGVEAALRGVASLSDRTVGANDVLTKARDQGLTAATIADLKGQDLEVLDRVSQTIASNNSLIAALEGAGCGIGGIYLLAADIPLLFGVAFRVVRLIGCAYGIEPAAADEKLIAFKIFELAAGGTRDRYAALLEIEALRDELDTLDPHERAEKAAVLAGLIASREVVRKIVTVLAGRKLLQTIPLAGMAVGAGFNYTFVADVARTARSVYRKRTIDEREKAAGAATPPKA